MPSCAIVSCPNNQRTKLSLVSGKVPQFHRFPQKGDVTQRRWVEVCNRNDAINLKKAVVCSDHFRPEDYRRNLQAELLGLPFTPRLKEDAVPNLNLNGVSDDRSSGGQLARGGKKKGGGGRLDKRRGMKAQISGVVKEQDPLLSVSEDSCKVEHPFDVQVLTPKTPESVGNNVTSLDPSLSSSAVVIPDRTYCLVCYSSCSVKNESGDDLRDRTLSTLSKHLTTIFIFRKVLELPLSEVEKYLSCSSNPEEWMGLCDQCSAVVDNCMSMHSQLMEITRDFQRSKMDLVEMIKKSVVGSNQRVFRSRFPTITDQSRRFVHERDYEYGQMSDPFEDGDRIAEELQKSSKKTIILLKKKKDDIKRPEKKYKKKKIFSKTTGGVGRVKDGIGTQSNPKFAAFANIFHTLKAKADGNVSIIPSEPITLAGKEGTVKQEPLEVDDGEDGIPDFTSEGIQPACEIPEDDIKQEVDEENSAALGDMDEEEIVILEKDDDYEWEMSDYSDGEACSGDEQTPEENKVTCSLCNKFKCKVRKAELLCQHLETCTTRPTTNSEEENGTETITSNSSAAMLTCPICHNFTAVVADKCNFAEHIGSCQGSPSSKVLPLTSRIFQCSICPKKKFMKLNRFILHYLHHKKMSRFACKKCPKNFTTRQSFHTHWYRRHLDLVKTIRRRSHRYKKITALPQIPWWCPTCSEKFSTEIARDDHIQSSHSSTNTESPVRTHKCSKCEKCYYVEEELKLHNSTVHLSEKHFLYCDICFEPAQYMKLLQRHKQQVHNQGFHKCTLCGKKYNVRQHLERHMRFHDPSYAAELTCSTCNKVMSSRSALTLHTNAVHRKLVRFFCQVCGRPFYDSTGFHRHMANVHQMGSWKTKFIPCPVEGCEHKARGKVKLANHLSWHRKDPQYKCSYCGKDFYFPEKLKRHERSHEITNPDDMPFQCDICGKKYVRKDLMLQHTRIHDPNRNVKRYSKKINNVVLKTAASYTCPVCELVCGGPRLRSKHLREVHPTYLKTCRTCGKVFGSEGTRHQHEMIKHERKYVKTCELCGKELMTADHLKRHHRQMHNIQ